ncbi:MAG: acetyl-CoA hydrolase/transferase family protein [Rhodospirillaceae bacterium]|nr:acetyl-CoA hydrolase/transferase family protein [Rhodospirillaceae bacterium]
MDLSATYAAKRMTATQAVADIPADSNIALAMAIGAPPALMAALADRVTAGNLTNLRPWYFHSMAHAGNTLLRADLLDRVRPHCMFLSSIERNLIKTAGAKSPGANTPSPIAFVPVAFSDSSRMLSQDIDLECFMVTVSPMDRHGWFSFGTNNDYATTVARSAKRLIVEVNANMPRVFGESPLHISEIDAIVENDIPLLDCAEPLPSAVDDVIAATIADLIDDKACIQMGIGALPNAVCSKLGRRKDLGIHTELMTPALARLIQCGAVTNRYKTTYPGRSVFTFAMGDRAFYDFLDDNPSMHSAPVHVVNDPRHIAKNDNVVSVNATLQVDLGGACNSEHVLGRQYSGAGGQLDFVRGARASKGGKSIIACHSTALDGTVSRIVPQLQGPVTTPRNDTHIIVTEYGWADLTGLTIRQRADALVKLAHPKFRDALAEQARSL